MQRRLFLFKFHLISYLVCLAMCARAQNGDYIVKDSSYLGGNVIFFKKDQLQFQKTKNDAPVMYSLNEIKAFGFQGEDYERLVVDGEQNFFKQIAKGDLSLYQKKGTFVLKHNDSLTQFNAKNFRYVLSSKVSCMGSDKSLSKLSYSKQSLRYFVRLSNQGNCNSDNLPYGKIGLMTGYASFNFNIDGRTNLKLSDKANSFSIGIFVEKAFYTPASLFVATELHFVKSNPSFYKAQSNTTRYMGLDVMGFMMPVSLKWIAVKGKVKPYLKAGPSISYLNLKSSSGFLETTSSAGVIEITRETIANKSNVLLGLNSGIGVELPLSDRKNLHLEMKYVKFFSGDFDSLSMNFTSLFLILGVNL